MTMQPELPWNVAGIAPEAREAARTSARREGLSVGEWLTRRILKNAADCEPVPDEWWLRGPALMPQAAVAISDGPALTGNGKEPHDRTNDDALEDTLDTIAAQVRQATLTRSEKIEELGARMAELDARLSRMERSASSRDLRDKQALHALHSRVAGLTEQISKVAVRSASQNTALAQTLQALAGKIVQSNSETHAQREAFDARVGAIADDVALLSGKLEQSRDDIERRVSGLDGRLAAMDAVAEKNTGDAQTVARLDEALHSLQRRVEISEAEYLENIERMETRLGRVEANAGESVLDGRLHGIEQTLAEMAKLLGKTARENGNVSAAAAAESAEAGEGDASRTGFVGVPILDQLPFPAKKAAFAAPQANAPLWTTVQDANPVPNCAADAPAPQSATAEPPDFLLSAANTVEPPGAARFGTDRPVVRERSDSPARVILIGALGILVLVAIGAGLYLRDMASHTPQISQPSRTASIAPRHLASHSRHLPAKQNAVPSPTGPSRAAGPAASPSAAKAASAGRSTLAQNAKPPSSQQRLFALADAGNAKAQEALGLEYVDGDSIRMNEAEGARWLERAAMQGEAVAAYRLGTLYERGHGVSADPAKAVRWYAAAAKAGNRKAMHNLAVAYAQGTGIQKDPAMAAQWFLRAANLGLADSQFNVAVLYERGMGVPQSLKEAYKWYSIAAAQGDAEARTRIQAIASQLKPADKVAAEKAAATFQAAPLDRGANAPPLVTSLSGG